MSKRWIVYTVSVLLFFGYWIAWGSTGNIQHWQTAVLIAAWGILERMAPDA